jgi:hypothetical protein
MGFEVEAVAVAGCVAVPPALVSTWTTLAFRLLSVFGT